MIGTGRSEKRVVMFGLDAAGKTTILYKLKLGEEVRTIPTIGFNVESLTYKFHSLTLWDLGLRDKARPLIRHYLPGMDAMIFVVDANDRDRLEDSREFLHYAVAAAEDCNETVPPVLIFANKLDLPGAMTVEEVEEGLLARRGLPRGLSTSYIQGCVASSGEGLYEGLDWLTQTLTGGARTSGGARATASRAPASKPEPSVAERGPAEGGQGGGQAEAVVEGSLPPMEAEDEDGAFLAAFEGRRLAKFGPEEMLRVAYLHRLRAPDASARVSFEAAKQLGYVKHATRMYFWAARLYGLPALEPAASFREFLESHAGLLPDGVAAQEAVVAEAYTDEVLANPLWALIPLPPDRTAGGREADSGFLARVEGLKVEEGELESFRALVRLAFALLCACERREAIRRMDAALRRLAEGWVPPSGTHKVTREYHETRQYAALQFAHLALASRPDLRDGEFSVLASRCPELCAEDCLRRYYSAGALASGKGTFVVPDLQPLPSVVAVPDGAWHEGLDDEAFLEALRTRTLPSWGLPCLVRCAYLLLQKEGRRQGLRSLLGEAADLREQPKLPVGLFVHETLAYFTLHMVHFFIASSGLPQEQPFAGFARTCPRCLDPLLYCDYYSDALLHSKEAQTELVLPDLCPLPSLVSAGPQ